MTLATQPPRALRIFPEGERTELRVLLAPFQVYESQFLNRLAFRSGGSTIGCFVREGVSVEN